MPVTDSAFKREKVKILTIVKPLFAGASSMCPLDGHFHCCILAGSVHDALIPSLARLG